MVAILVLLPIITSILIFIIHPYIYKITKKYWFTCIISIVFLVYFIIFRYVPDLMIAIKEGSIPHIGGEGYRYSFYASKTLLLDLCPLMMFLIPVALIVDPTKNFAKILAPLGLMGAVVTLFGGVPFDDAVTNLAWSDFWKYIFLGVDHDGSLNRLYFMMHYMLLIISLIALLNSSQYTKWSMFGAHVFFVAFLIYALTLSSTFNITNNVTGLVQNDWYGGGYGTYNEYGTLYKMLPMSFPGIVIFWYFIGAIAFYTICIIKNYFTNDCFKLTSLNKKFYEKWTHQNKFTIFLKHIDEQYDLMINKIKAKWFI